MVKDDDGWSGDDIMMIIGSDELDASIEAAEHYEDFLKVEEEEELSSYQHLTTEDKHSTKQLTAATSGSVQQCNDLMCEADSFLDAVNWDEAFDNTWSA